MPLSKSHGREMQMSLRPFAFPHSRTRAPRAHPARFMGGERSDYSAEKVKWHPDERSDWLATKWNKTSRIREFYYSNNDDDGDDAIDRTRDEAVSFISTWQTLMQTRLKVYTCESHCFVFLAIISFTDFLVYLAFNLCFHFITNGFYFYLRNISNYINLK